MKDVFIAIKRCSIPVCSLSPNKQDLTMKRRNENLDNVSKQSEITLTSTSFFSSSKKNLKAVSSRKMT